MDTKSFEERYASAKKAREEKTFATLPPGRYTAVLADAFRNVSKQGQGTAQVCLVWKVLEGEQADKEHRQYFNLENDVAVEILDSTLVRFDFDTSNMSLDILDTIIETLKTRIPMAMIILKQKGEYLNTNMSEFLGWTVDEEAEEKPAPKATPKAKVNPAPKAKAVAEESVPEEPEAEGEAEGEDGAETVAPGTKIKFTAVDGTEKTGIVQAVDEEKGIVDVKVGLKVFKAISAEMISEIL